MIIKKFPGVRFSLLLIFVLIGNYLKGQLYINEFLTSNASKGFDNTYQEYSDWIEIYNGASTEFNLTDFFLSDNKENPLKWRFPSGTSIAAGGYLFVWADGRNTGLHTNFKLNSTGGELGIFYSSSAVVDTITYGKQTSDVSYGRKPNGSNIWRYFAQPTPNASNSTTGYNSISPDPVFSPIAGFYSGSQSVTIEGSENIRYTTNGIGPTESSALYSSPISVNSNTVIKARIYDDNNIPGKVLSQTYFINEPASGLPVISLSTDPDNFWDNQIGIYVEGTNGISGNCYGSANWNQDWERAASIEIFANTGTFQYQKNIGTKILGGCSRTHAQKSLAIIARSKYETENIEYKLFEDKPNESFKSFILRNSGNDWGYTMYRDAFMQAIVKDEMDVDYQAYQPAIMYLNGTYWGIHNIREKINEHYVVQNYGLNVDDVQMLSGSGANEWDIINGSNVHYLNMMSFIRNNNMTSQSNYAYVKKQMDMDEYINFLITEIFVSNTDWPGNNMKYWRNTTNYGKWRWILYDLDFGFGMYGGERYEPWFNTLAFAHQRGLTEWPNPDWSTELFDELLASEEFRNEFIQRFAFHLNSTFQPARLLTLIDDMRDVIANEMPRHINKWGQPNSMENWNDNRIQKMRDFANQRSGYVRQHIIDEFSLSGMATLTVNNANLSSGKVKINDYLLINDSSYSGEYFMDVPLNLYVSVNPGYTFSHWLVNDNSSVETILLYRGSEWKYLDNGSDQGTAWYGTGFNDDAWSSGFAELGYGDGDEQTTVSYGGVDTNKYITTYFRKAFDVADASIYEELKVYLRRDDGGVVYLNGTEVLRVNMNAGAFDYLTFTNDYAGGDDEITFFEYNIDESLLISGTNVIAVEIHQNSLTSSDISFDLELAGVSSSGGNQTTVTDYPLELTLDENVTIEPVFETVDEVEELYINEFMASNTGVYMDDHGDYSDWIELYNAGNKPVNIGGMYFSDDITNPGLYKMPETDPDMTTIQPGDFLVLFADGNTAQGILHLDFELNKAGEQIVVSQVVNSQLEILNSIAYSAQYSNVSYGRYPDASDNFYPFTTYTPGESNIYGFTDVPEMFTSNNTNLIIYPNPTDGQVTVLVQNDNLMATDIMIDVINITGQKVRSELFNSVYAGDEISIDLSQYKSGMYIIRINTGKDIVTGRVYKR